VQCLEPLEALLEFRRGAIVGLNLRQEQGVATANLGLVKDEEGGGARGCHCVTGLVGTSIFTERVVLGIAIDNVELGEALDVSRRRVPLDGTEVLLEHSRPNWLAER